MLIMLTKILCLTKVRLLNFLRGFSRPSLKNQVLARTLQSQFNQEPSPLQLPDHAQYLTWVLSFHHPKGDVWAPVFSKNLVRSLYVELPFPRMFALSHFSPHDPYSVPPPRLYVPTCTAVFWVQPHLSPHCKLPLQWSLHLFRWSWTKADLPSLTRTME